MYNVWYYIYFQGLNYILVGEVNVESCSSINDDIYPDSDDTEQDDDDDDDGDEEEVDAQDDTEQDDGEEEEVDAQDDAEQDDDDEDGEEDECPQEEEKLTNIKRLVPNGIVHWWSKNQRWIFWERYKSRSFFKIVAATLLWLVNLSNNWAFNV